VQQRLVQKRQSSIRLGKRTRAGVIRKRSAKKKKREKGAGKKARKGKKVEGRMCMVGKDIHKAKFCACETIKNTLFTRRSWKRAKKEDESPDSQKRTRNQNLWSAKKSVWYFSPQRGAATNIVLHKNEKNEKP